MRILQVLAQQMDSAHFGQEIQSQSWKVDQFANFGTNRMSDYLGDDIHLHAIALRNLKIQHEIDVREGHVDTAQFQLILLVFH